MGAIPTTKADNQWRNTAGDDFLQLLDAKGARLSWIDSNGIPQGSLASGGGGVASGAVSPLTFGAKADVKFVYDAAATNGSAIITCPTNNCNFQCPNNVYPCALGGDVGKIIFGNSGPSAIGGQNPTSQMFLLQTTIIQVNNANSVTVATPAIAGCAVSAGSTCALAWGTQDDAPAIRAAEVAAWQNANNCLALELPSGAMFIGSNILGTPGLSACGGGPNPGGDSTQTGPTVFGTGPGTTTFIPLPSFDFSTCTNPGGIGTACLGGSPALYAHDFGVNGLGQGLPSTTHNVDLFLLRGFSPDCTGSVGRNLAFAQWGFQSTGTQGIHMGLEACGGGYYSDIISEGFGKTICVVEYSNVVNLRNVYCLGSNGTGSFLVQGQGGTLNTFGCVFTGTQLDNSASVFFAPVGGIWNSFGDSFSGQFQINNNLIQVSGGSCQSAPCYINIIGGSFSLNPLSTRGFTFYIPTSGVNLKLRDNLFALTGAQNSFISNLAAGSSIFDEGGNTVLQGSQPNSISGNVFGSQSATGIASATGNWALTSGWGTSSVTAAIGDSHRTRVTIVTTVAGAASPVLTWTFPAQYPFVAPTSCRVTQVGGTFGVITNPVPGTPTATSVAITFAGTPTANTYIFDVSCGP